MKPQLLTIFCATMLAAGVFSCKGPEGPQGPAGTQGTAGAQGAQGPKGDQGNANVVTTAWTAPKWNTIYDYAADGLVYAGQINEAAKNPLITEDVLNKAALFTYIKYRSTVYDSGSQTFKLDDFVTSKNSGVRGEYQIPNTTGATRNDFLWAEISIGDLQVNTIPIWAWIGISQNRINVPAVTGKSNQFYTDLIKDAFQIRHIIVYGNPSGRMADINWDNYDEVKEALGLEN